ncbi:MAG: SOS response-associated peptidase family protein, partial [Rhodoferax sp.]|nr:SOS response-associated peptidase family protein [Rhodoferax sp.]
RTVPACITRKDGEPMGLAGLWSSWKSAQGDIIHSYTLLTINAEHHPLLRLMQSPTHEKRMVVILPEAAYGDWLTASAAQSHAYLQPYPAELLQASAPRVDGGLF